MKCLWLGTNTCIFNINNGYHITCSVIGFLSKFLPRACRSFGFILFFFGMFGTWWIANENSLWFFFVASFSETPPPCQKRFHICQAKFAQAVFWCEIPCGSLLRTSKQYFCRRAIVHVVFSLFIQLQTNWNSTKWILCDFSAVNIDVCMYKRVDVSFNLKLFIFCCVSKISHWLKDERELNFSRDGLLPTCCILSSYMKKGSRY